MTTLIADDYGYIKARMEQIATERALAPEVWEMQEAVENYMAGEPAKEPAMYMGWDIYAPVNVNQANG
jgi:hypothetical protein